MKIVSFHVPTDANQDFSIWEKKTQQVASLVSASATLSPALQPASILLPTLPLTFMKVTTL